MNFARDVVDAAPPERRAIVELARDGTHREWTMGEIASGAAALAAELDRRGVRRGDVVLTLLGNRPEWVLTMVACFRQGYVALPCTEQLRAADLRLRLDVAAADTARVQLGGERRRAARDLAHRPLAARAVAGELDDRAAVRRGGLDYVAGEVHGGSG